MRALCWALLHYVNISSTNGGSNQVNKTQRDTLQDKTNLDHGETWLEQSLVPLCAGLCHGMLSLPSGAANIPPLLFGPQDSLVLRKKKELIK